ncbi:hypothetical protein C8Q80DRAFT_1094487 [Daedaleopsis nitida]|nr:hypothetical protein C8Q80DRAFT_1094487 [Daedaleopsis nitida]
MSSDSDDDLPQEILDAYGRLVVENYCIIASSVILFADSLFTLTDEIQRIWSRRFSGATLIFLVTRWVAVAERIVLVTSVVLPTLQDKVIWIARSPPSATSSCVPVLRLDDTLTDISYLSFGSASLALFMMLRIRGIWGSNGIPVALIALLTPIRPIISIYTQTRYTPIAFGEPLYGCGAVFDLDPLYAALGIISRAAGLALDTAVLILTWYKTFGIKRGSKRLGVNTPYITLILRDGTLYFLTILFVQTFGIISVSVSDFSLFIVWPYFDQVFTVIFLTRFMLNLRGVYLSSDRVHYDSHGGVLPPSQSDFTATTLSAIHFSSAIVGNMGAPLHTSSSLGSQTLYSPSQASYSVRGARSDYGDGETGWEMEDDGVETSSDPLVAGLLVGGDMVELGSISAKEEV